MNINKTQTASGISNDYLVCFAYVKALESQAYCHTRCQGLCSINYQ